MRRLPMILKRIWPDFISASNLARPMFRYSIASFLLRIFFNILLTFRQYEKYYIIYRLNRIRPRFCGGLLPDAEQARQ
nr:MAG TPA: hypothetical protein [Bacteriophage sp.]